MKPVTATSAASITKAASKQTYYTIRFLADQDRVDDAYRAYGYFRWVDDILDADSGAGAVLSEVKAAERSNFLQRQESLLSACYRGRAPRDENTQEKMLVELVQHDHEKNSGLQSYLANMMQVMNFDVKRHGKLSSQVELNEYTRWLTLLTALLSTEHQKSRHMGFFSLGRLVRFNELNPCGPLVF